MIKLIDARIAELKEKKEELLNRYPHAKKDEQDILAIQNTEWGIELMFLNKLSKEFSNSFSDTEVKWLVYYGKTSDVKDAVEIGDTSVRIDFAIDKAFELLKEHTIFNTEEVKRVFWERLTLLANYR